MARKTFVLVVAAAVAASSLQAAPSAIPATLKTLESILAGIDLPSQDAGSGVQPLHSAMAAADAMLSSLDPNGDSGASLEAPATAQEAVDCGLLVGRMYGYPAVTGMVPDSSAFYAPLREGDRILAANGKPLAAGISMPALRKLLRGKAGEKVTLRVLHSVDNSTADVELEFGEIRPGTECRVLPGGVAYVTLSGPSALVLAEYKLALAKLKGEKLIGVVLDLRGASRGGAQDAVAIVDPFLSERTVVTEIGATTTDKVHRSGRERVTEVPLVVLVGSGTSGAAELAAAALQANRRALILGAATQGRATEYRQLQQGGVYLTLPALLHRTSDGTLLTGRGLRPDIEVEQVPLPRNQARWFGEQRLAFAKGVKWEPKKEETETEKELQAALEEEGGEEEPREEHPKPDAEATAEEDAALKPSDPFHEYSLVKRYDPRLVRAIHLLKAASIFFENTRSGD